MTSDELGLAPGDLRVSWAVRASRLGYILRYHRPSQLIGRLASMARRKWLGISGARRYVLRSGFDIGLRDEAEVAAWTRGRITGRGPKCREHAWACIEGRFRFLNIERLLPDPIDWRLSDWPHASHLWRFHLQYHDYLRDLGAAGSQTGRPEFLKRAWDIALQWIDANRAGDRCGLRDAWHPYCISRRVPAWIELWLTGPPSREGDRVLDSLFRQARFLADHLEFDVGGNHLLENLRALIVAGAFFGGRDGDQWVRRGSRLLDVQLNEQILEHGEHFERSPMYPLQMLDAVLDIAEVTASLVPATAARCGEAAQRMARFLNEILHLDGDIPLLGDSGFEPANSPGHLIERAAKVHSRIEGKATGSATAVELAANVPGFRSIEAKASRVGDYWIYRHNDDFVLLDAGPVCPDHLPAHGHAYLLQLEASWHRRRLLVDSGVFNYQDNGMRHYCRSTAAHNVLQIDGRAYRSSSVGWLVGPRAHGSV